MFRWFERFAVIFVLVLTVGVLLACWAPAYVGPTAGGGPHARWQRERPGQRGGGNGGGGNGGMPGRPPRQNR